LEAALVIVHYVQDELFNHFAKLMKIIN